LSIPRQFALLLPRRAFIIFTIAGAATTLASEWAAPAAAPLFKAGFAGWMAAGLGMRFVGRTGSVGNIWPGLVPLGLALLALSATVLTGARPLLVVSAASAVGLSAGIAAAKKIATRSV